ncbi:gp58-like family protein, partial [Streptococcus cristatus]|uniref:gp58-like family protein n=1 Tax=Streptococcus cristatus TaxID=45634 RepID=UPI0028EBC11A
VENQISAVGSSFKQRADSIEAGVSSLREGLKTKADSSALNLLSDRISASVKSLETDTQNKLNSKLSTAEFDVRANRISQEIINATKDKADRALVTAEAGRLREELASLSVGGRNYFLNSDFEITSGNKGIKVHPDFVKHAKGKKIVMSVQVSGENVVAQNQGRFGLSASAGIAGSVHRDWPEVWETGTGNISKKRIYQVFDFKDNWVDFVANLYIQTGAGAVAGYPKLEISTVPTDWSPAPEDADGLITEAKATFERTAQGLRTDLSAVQAYVNSDGTRAEALRTFSREETARQLTAERKAIEAGYVAKAQHTEDVRSISRRFEELAVGGRNLALGTSKEWSTPFTNFSGNANVCPSLYKVLTDGLQVGDTLRSKIILKYTDVRPATGKTATVWMQGNGNVTGWTAGSYNGSPAKTISGSGEITFEHSFKITENHLKNAYWNWMFRTDFIASGSLEWRLAKVESGSVYTSWSPAPEDATSYADTKLAEFRQGIDGQLASVQAALNTANGSLTSFNTWKQSAQETLNKVGRVETGLNETKTSLAEFKRTAEGQLTTITQQITGKASQTDFQRVQETSKLYERLIGSTEKEVADKVSRMTLSNELFQVEVSKNLGLRTVQYQIANAWAVQNLNSNGDIVSQINMTGPNVRIQGESIHLDGKALIDNGIIKNAMIESMLADKITAGTLNAANVNIINLNANKIVGLDANFIKSKIELAFIEWMKGKVISAQNDAMQIDLNNGQYNVMTDQAAIRRVLNGYPNQFLKFTSETEGGAPASVTVLGANRDGTENSKNDSFAGIRLFSGNKVERTEIISDVVRFATGAVNYRGWEMRTLYGNDNKQVILQPFGNVTRSNIVANYFNGIDLVNVLETLNQMMANLGNHTGRHDIFGPIRGLGARKYAR